MLHFEYPKWRRSYFFDLDTFPLFQPAKILRANADPNVDVPGHGGVPRPAHRSDVPSGLPLETPGRNRPRRDGRHAEDQQTSAEAYSTGSCCEPLPEQGVCARRKFFYPSITT